MVSAEQLVLDLCDPELRENALLDLSKVALLPPPTLQLSPHRRVSLYTYLCRGEISLFYASAAGLTVESMVENRGICMCRAAVRKSGTSGM
jgi:hypothetical protein